MHPRHDVPLGSTFPETANAVIEVPLGSKSRYEVDEETGLLRLSRGLPVPAAYPVSYGFYPRTTAPGGTALDALILSRSALRPLTVVESRPVGLISLSTRKGREAKIVSVAVKDPVFGKFKSLRDLGRRLDELKKFLRDCQELEFDPVNALGTGDAEKARAALRKAAEAYAGARAGGPARPGAR